MAVEKRKETFAMSNTNDTNFNIESMLEEHPARQPVGVKQWEQKKVYCSATRLLKAFAGEVACAVRETMRNSEVADSDVLNVFLVLIALRILQLRGFTVKGLPWKNVVIPDFFYPFLARISDLDLPMLSLRVDVCVDEAERIPDEDGCRIPKEVTLEMWHDVEATINRMRRAGVKVSLGMPQLKTTSDDAMFRICYADEMLLVAGPDVGEVNLFFRSLLTFTFLEEIWGDARTRYAGVEDYRTAFFLLADRALTHQ